MVEERKIVRTAKKVITGFTIVFLILLFLYGVRMLNGETCGREEYTYYNYGALQTGITINANDDTVLQHNPYNEEIKINYWELCFTYNATNPIELHIVNSADEILGHIFLQENYNYECYAAKFNKTTENYNYIGLRCDNCGTKATSITFYEETLGEQTERVVLNGGVTITQDNTLDWVLHGYPSCWKNIKYFSIWWLTGLIFMLIIIFLIAGLKKTEEIIKND